jgi:hypothetical protein
VISNAPFSQTRAPPGALSGEGIRQAGKYHGHPEEGWEPVEPRGPEPPVRSLWESP